MSTPLVWQTVFVGSQFDTLAESVLRQRAIYNLDGNGNRILSSGTMTTNMQTRVVNITGQKDFFLQQLNTDYVSLSSWDTTTIYTPTGSAAEVLAGDPSKFLNTRSWSAANGQPLAVPTASLSGSDDVAALYTSLLNGAVSANTGTTIPGAIPSTTSDLQFDGTAKGSVVTHTGAFDLSTTGTIEAWVYVKQHTDTGGIVHKGVQADFLDECYSLQFWGNNGQVAFVIDGSGGGNNYDLVTSSINLNTGAWYYLVATWDNLSATEVYEVVYERCLAGIQSSRCFHRRTGQRVGRSYRIAAAQSLQRSLWLFQFQRRDQRGGFLDANGCRHRSRQLRSVQYPDSRLAPSLARYLMQCKPRPRGRGFVCAASRTPAYNTHLKLT